MSDPNLPEGVTQADIDRVPLDGSYDCEDQELIVCPYCGEDYEKSAVVAENMKNEQVSEINCSGCGTDFSFMVHIAVTYSSFKR